MSTMDEMKKTLKEGKTFKCPKCKDGYWKVKNNNHVYYCDKCNLHIIERADLKLDFTK